MSSEYRLLEHPSHKLGCSPDFRDIFHYGQKQDGTVRNNKSI